MEVAPYPTKKLHHDPESGGIEVPPPPAQQQKRRRPRGLSCVTFTAIAALFLGLAWALEQAVLLEASSRDEALPPPLLLQNPHRAYKAFSLL